MSEQDLSGLQKTLLPVFKGAEKIYKAMPRQVQGFLGGIFAPSTYREKQLSTADTDTLKTIKSPVAVVQELGTRVKDIVTKNNKTFPGYEDLDKNLQSMSKDLDSMLGSAVSRANKSMTLDWNKVPEDTRRQFKSQFDSTVGGYYKTIQQYGSQEDKDAMYKSPVVREYLAYRSKQGTAPVSFGEKAGQILGGLFSPYTATAGFSAGAVGKMVGSEELANVGKATIGEQFYDKQLRDNPEQYSLAHAGKSYLLGGGMRDLIPVIGAEGKSLVKDFSVIRKYGRSLPELTAKLETTWGKQELEQANKFIYNSKKLSSQVKELGMKEGSMDAKQMTEFLKSPAAQKDLFGKFEKNAKGKYLTENIKQVADMTRVASEGIPVGTLKQHLTNTIKDFYVTSPGMLKFMGGMTAIQMGSAALGEATDNEAVKTAGNFFMQPIPTLMHLGGIGKLAVQEDVMKQYADGYGIPLEQIRAMPDKDPFKMEIMKAADQVYASTSFSNMVGWMPSSNLGKIAAAFLDTSIDYLGVKGYMKGGAYAGKKIGIKGASISPVDKDGNLTIKPFAEIEAKIQQAKSTEEGLKNVQQDIANLQKYVEGKTFAPIEGIKVEKLFNQSIEKLKGYLELAQSVYGMKFGTDFGSILDRINNTFKSTSDPEVRKTAGKDLGYLSAQLHTAMENVTRITDADQLKADIAQEVNRADMSFKYLTYLKDANGLGKSFVRTIVKGFAKGWNTWSSMVLNDEMYQKYGHDINNVLTQTKSITKTFKLEEKQLNLVRGYYKAPGKEKGADRYVSQQIDTAIDNKLQGIIGNLKDMDIKSYEQLHSTLKAAIYNSLYESFIYKSSVDGRDKQLGAITNNILKQTITGSPIQGQKSKLGEVLSKLSQGKYAKDNTNSIVESIKDVAFSFSKDEIVTQRKGLDESKQKAAEQTKALLANIKDMSALQRGLKSMMDLNAVHEIRQAPDQLREVLGDFKNAQEFLDKLSTSYSQAFPGKQLEIQQMFKEKAAIIQEKQVLDNTDMDTYLKLFVDSKSAMEKMYTEDIANIRKSQTEVSDLIRGVEQLTPEAMKNGSIDFEQLPVAFHGIAKSFQNLNGALDIYKNTAGTSQPVITKEFMENKDLNEDSMNVDEIPVDTKPANILFEKIKTNLGDNLLQIKPISNEQLYALANKPNVMNETNFVVDALLMAGFKDTDTIMNKPSLQPIIYDLQNKFRSYKHGFDINNKTYNYNYNFADGSVTPGDKMKDQKFVPYSDGIKRLGVTDTSMGPIESPTVANMKIINIPYNVKPNLNPNGKPEKMTTERWLEYKTIWDNLSQDSVLLPVSDANMKVYSFRPDDVIADAAKDGITLDRTDPDFQKMAEFYVHGKFSGTPQVNQWIKTKDYPKLQQYVINTQKYMSKLAGNYYASPVKYDALVLNDRPYTIRQTGKEIDEQDGTIYAMPSVHEQTSKFAGYQNPDNTRSGIKIQYNGPGFGVKGYQFELNKPVLTDILNTKGNLDAALNFIAEKGHTYEGPKDAASVATYIFDNHLSDYIVMNTAHKNYLKNIEGTEAPTKQFTMDGVRIYPIASDSPTPKSMATFTNQGAQAVVGEYGNKFANALQKYLKHSDLVPAKYINGLLKALEQNDMVGLQEQLKKNFDIFFKAGAGEGLLGVEKNIFSMSGPELQQVVSNIINNNIVRKKLPGDMVTLRGLPDAVGQQIKQQYGLTDDNYVVVSKSYFDKEGNQERETGEPVLMQRNPVTGPKSMIGAKAIFIEDLPAGLKDYFVNEKGLPVNELFINPSLTQKKEADFDGDQTYIYPEFSKFPVEGKQTVGDMMHEYSNKVDQVKNTWTPTDKPNFKDYQSSYGKDMAKDGVGLIAFTRQFSKDATSHASALARGMSILNRDMFKGMPTEKLIEFQNEFAKYIQAAVDGNLKGNYADMMKPWTRQGGFNDLAFPNLSKTNKKALNDYIKQYVVTGQGGIFGWLSKGDGALLLPQKMEQIQGAKQSMDILTRLKAIDSLGKTIDDKTLGEYLTNTMDKLPSDIQNKVKELQDINNKDKHIWLNDLDIIKNEHIQNINHSIADYKTLQYNLMAQNMKIPYADIYFNKSVYDAKYNPKGFIKYGQISNEDVGRFTKALELYPQQMTLTALVFGLDKKHPELRQHYDPVIVQKFDELSATHDQTYINAMSSAIQATKTSPMFAAMEKETTGFGKFNKKFTIGAYIINKDYDGLKQYLKDNRLDATVNTLKELDDQWNANKEVSQVEQAITANMREREMANNDVEAIQATKDVIGGWLDKVINTEQAAIAKNGHSAEVQKFKGTLFEMHKLMESGDKEIMDKFWTPIKEIESQLRGLGEAGERAIASGLAVKYLKQMFNNMYQMTANKVFQQVQGTPMVTEHQKPIAQSEKSYKRNLQGLITNIMGNIKEGYATDFHKNVLDTYAKVQDILFQDKAVVTELARLMQQYGKKGVSLAEAQAMATRQIAIDYKNIDISKETQDKIMEASKSTMGDMGKIISDLTDVTASTMKELSAYNIDINNSEKVLKDKMFDIMQKAAVKEGSAADFLSETINTLNTLYKTSTLGIAAGRFLTEGVNSAWMRASKQWTKGSISDEQSFMKQFNRQGELKIPTDFSDKSKFKERNKYQSKFFATRKDRPQSYKDSWMATARNWMGTISEKVSNVSYSWITEKFMMPFFKTSYFTELKNYIEFKAQDNPMYADKAKRLLTTSDGDLTADERYTKGKMLLEVERLATKDARESFFDYTENPMFISKMEQYVPFSNFLFNSAKIFAKNPAMWITAMNFGTNLMNEWSTPMIDIDGEDLRAYVNVNKFALPILGALGFGNLGFDINRFLPIDMTNIRAFGYPYQKMFFPTGDSDYVKLMDSGNKFTWFDYGIKKLAPAIYDLISPLRQNDMGLFVKRLGFMFTGLSFSNDSAKQMLASFYSNDYDKMLNASPFMWNQFNSRRENKGMTKISKENIASLKAFNTVVFSNSSGNNQGYDYINVLSDYTTMQLTNPGQGIYQDMNPVKEINKGLKGVFTDMAVGLAWNNGESLADKAHKLSTSGVDKEGNLVPLKAGQKSVLENMRDMGTMTDFLDRMDFYAEKYDAIKLFQTSNNKYRKYNIDGQPARWGADEVGTVKDNAIVGAFKYYFKEEMNDPYRQNLEDTNPAEYLKQKAEKITNGTFTLPLDNDMSDSYGSKQALTSIYKQYMLYGKGIVLTDLEQSKARISTLERLKSINIQQARDPNNASSKNFYWDNYNKLTNAIEAEKLLFEKYNPNMHNLDEILDVNQKIKNGEASTWPEAQQLYKEGVAKKYNKIQNNYLSAKIKYLKNNIMDNKTASFKFTQENGMSPQQMIAVYQLEQQSIGQ